MAAKCIKINNVGCHCDYRKTNGFLPFGRNGNGHSPELRAFASGGGFMCLEHTFPGDMHQNSFDVIEESAKYVSDRIPYQPKIGIICGSGLGGLADQLTCRTEILYENIPNFPVSTVKGHVGKLVVGELESIPVVCMQGRFHSYEGYALWKCAMPVRVMKLMGVEKLLVTNAAGGLNDKYSVGDIMVLKDHVDMLGMSGASPLRGRNDERFGPRFPAMNNSYDRTYRHKAKEVAKDLGIDQSLREGVYVMLGGPTYETVAELKMLRYMGIDAVGMSTVPEVVVAKHCGMRVFAFSLITNKCITDYEEESEANHEEVIAVANKKKSDLIKFAKKMVTEINRL